MDQQGRLANVQSIEPHGNVKGCFDPRQTSIPVWLERDNDDPPNSYKTIKPLLNDWEKKYSNLESKYAE